MDEPEHDDLQFRWLSDESNDDGNVTQYHEPKTDFKKHIRQHVYEGHVYCDPFMCSRTSDALLGVPRYLSVEKLCA
jgi:hypothetical protein